MNTSDEWWRPRTLQFHWYQLNNSRFYSDWGDATDLPDILVSSAGFELGLGADVGFITDRYGNTYVSTGIGSGFGVNLGSTWEGYAHGRGPLYTGQSGLPNWKNPPTEPELRDIIEGAGFSYTVMTPFAGGSLDVWHTGMVYLFGGRNAGLEVSASFGWTWHTGQHFSKAWSWVDDRIPRYDCSVKNAFDSESEQTSCDCE